MNLLALDCSTDFLNLALQKQNSTENHTIFEIQSDGGAKASAQLIPSIEQLLQQSGLSYADLAGIIFGAGPGAFTGLRTAATVAQGLAFGANVRILGLNTLAAVAETARADFFSQALEKPDYFFTIATLDARMGQVYAQAWGFSREGWQNCILDNSEDYQPNQKFTQKIHWQAFSEALVINPEDLTIPTIQNPNIPNASIIWSISGNAADIYPNLGEKIQNHISTQHFARPNARALLALAPQFWAQSHAGHQAHRAELTYVRDRVALTTQQRLAAGGVR